MKKENTALLSLSRKEGRIIETISTNDDGELSGHELAKVDRQMRSGIYVTLSRMVKKGYLKSRLVEPKVGETGPGRRVYAVTEQGLALYLLATSYQEPTVAVAIADALSTVLEKLRTNPKQSEKKMVPV